MKKPIRHVLLNVFSIALISHLFPGISYQSDLRILLVASVILSLINLFIKPILKIVLLPINMITFGMAGWIVQSIMLYLTTLIVEGFSISAFSAGPLNLGFFIVPKIIFSGIWSYVGASFAFSIVSNLIYWIL